MDTERIHWRPTEIHWAAGEIYWNAGQIALTADEIHWKAREFHRQCLFFQNKKKAGVRIRTLVCEKKKEQGLNNFFFEK